MAELNLGKIGVLMGGPSTEREISFKSGNAVYEALRRQGIEAVSIDITTDNPEDNFGLITSFGIDCAFLALHGRFGEDGTIQELLERMGIPYTASGVQASKLAMDKIASRRLFIEAGLSVPLCLVLNRNTYTRSDTDKLKLPLPVVVKPASHGSSIGLSIVDRKEELSAAIEIAFRYDERILVEEYIRGREITVGILDEQALPVIEIMPHKRFFDYEAKYKAGLTEYIVPAVLASEVVTEAQRAGITAHRSLGCFGCSRVDMLLDEKNRPFVLELNSIPGLTPTSLLPKAAKAAGIDFFQLCVTLIKLAYERTKAGLSR